MKYLKSIVKGLFVLLILGLLVSPLALIYEISVRERAQYEVPQAPIFHEVAYGAAVQAQRMDMRECINVSGVFRSETYTYMELKQQDPSRIRWDVSSGDEVLIGQVLGTYLGKEVISSVEGVITEINLYGDPYLKVRRFTPVFLEISVDQSTAGTLNRAESLTTEEGIQVTVISSSRVPDDFGMIKMKLSFDTDRYTLGDRLSDETLYTGTSYLHALVLPEACLYQKVSGEDEPWYARQVSADGFYINEIEIVRGYSNGEYCCVSGVTENQYFDSGYRAIMGNGG